MHPDPQNDASEDIKTKLKINWKQFFLAKWWILLMLIPLAITVVVRLEPMNLAPLERSAESSVSNFYRSQIQAGIEKQYPNLPQSEIDKLTSNKFQEFLQKEEKNVKEQIKANSEMLKSRAQYESGRKKYAYLGDIDSYYWLRISRNIIEKGMQCDIVKDSVCYDSYTLAPNLTPMPMYYYPVTIVMVYKIGRLFDTDLSLMQASFLTPLIFSLLLTIPLFLLLRRIGGNITAVVGAVLANVNPSFLSRSLGSDSDIVNVAFQALFLWLAVECFVAKKKKVKYIMAFLAGTSLSLYSRFWTGWWYLAYVFIISVVFGCFYLIIKQRHTTGRFELQQLRVIAAETALVMAYFLVAIILFYGLIFESLPDLAGVVSGPLGVLKFKVAARQDLWPNVLTTVAEFNSMSLGSIVSSFGVTWRMQIFLIAVLGMVFLIFPNIKLINKHIFMFMFLIAFNIILYIFLKSSDNGLLVFFLLVPIFIGMCIHLKTKDDTGFNPDVVLLLAMIICLVVYFTTIGARFLFLMTLPVSMFAALFFTKACKMVFSIAKKLIALPNVVYLILTILLGAWFLAIPVRAGFGTAQSYMPMVTDEWVETLEKIRNESNPDAIINSWWDFGHWFKYFADRRVTLDGSSQNNPQLHWLGKLLLTSEENASRGILRMLDCGGNNAFNSINKRMNDTPHSIIILNSIIVQKKGQAGETLRTHGFTPPEIDEILNYSHCTPPENFLITSQDMIGKGGVWSHFGSWNFVKAYLSASILAVPESRIMEKLKKDYDIPEETAKKWVNEIRSLKNENEINAWIVPWHSYQSGFDSCINKDGIFVCKFSGGDGDIPVILDFGREIAYIPNADGTKGYLKEFAFIEKGGFYSAKNSNYSVNIGVAAIKEGGSVSAAFMAPELAGSMFTRLFFFDGVGLSSFEKFYDTRTVYGERIITWKVRWDKEDE